MGEARIMHTWLDGTNELLNGEPLGDPGRLIPGYIELPAVGIEMELHFDFPTPVPNATANVFATLLTIIFHSYDDPGDPWAYGSQVVGSTYVYGTDFGGTGMPRPPCTLIHPFASAKPFVKVWIMRDPHNGEAPNHSWGFPTLEVVVHTMDIAIYKHLKKTEKTLDKQIDACGESVTEHDAASLEAAEKKAELVLAKNLYDNLMSDEMALYEAVNPPA